MIETTKFRTIVADPPWRYADKLRQGSTKRSADDHYDTMTVGEIEGLAIFPLPDHLIAGHAIAEPAVLFLWVTNPMLLDGSGVDVVKAWGFTPKQLITWVKGRPQIGYDDDGDSVISLVYHMGMGWYTRGATEHVILATRGKATGLIKHHGMPNVFLEPRTRHSAKPDVFYEGVEQLVPGPYLELFARKKRPGWTVWGNEVEESNADTND